MIPTKENKFSVSLIDENHKAYPILKLEDKYERPYVISEKSCVFMILVRVNTEIMDVSKVYGAKLFIDEREINSNKTFKRTGRFFGFRVGNGVYKQFMFSSLRMSEDDDDLQTGNVIGNIKIVFYNTKPVLNRNNELIKRKNKVNNEITIPIVSKNKKKCLQGIQVNVGREFTSNYTTKQRLDSYKNFNNEKYDYITDSTQDIDEIDFRYSDFDYMRARGFIQLSNLDHAIYLPFRAGVDMKICAPVIIGIIKKHCKENSRLDQEKLHFLFNKYAGHPLELYYSKTTTFEEFANQILKDVVDIEGNVVNKIYLKKSKISPATGAEHIEDLLNHDHDSPVIPKLPAKKSVDRSISSILREFDLNEDRITISLIEQK